MTVRIDLLFFGAYTVRRSDQVEFVFDESMLQSIAKALAMLKADESVEILLALENTDAFFQGGKPWPPQDQQAEDFNISELFLHATPQELFLEIWEADSNDQLHGFAELAKLPALSEAVERHRRWAEIEVLQSLCAAAPEAAAACAPMSELLATLRLAETWLVKLGDHIGKGTPGDPMGRCNTLLAVRRALGLVPGIEGNASTPRACDPAATADH